MININKILMPFRELIEKVDEKLIDDMLENFNCSKEPFIEEFVRKKSRHVEAMGSTKLYFILDEDQSNSDHLCALGFYALSLKVLVIKKEMSGNEIKNLHLKDNDKYISTYYIALLAKNDKYKEEIKGKEIIDSAINTIIEAVKCVGGRVTWVEAKKKHEKVVDFYVKNGFKEFQTEVQNDGLYSHLIRVVKS